MRGCMDLKVSVIIPVYNVEKYLPACLDSVLGQTLREIEVICVNDGSTDKSPEILQEYAKKDSRIIVINQENKGLGSARNRAIEIAKGEYIGFVDSDDYIDADFYEKLYNAALKHNAEIAAAGYRRVSSSSKSIRLRFKNEKLYINADDKYKATNIPEYWYVWNKIYKLSDIRMINLLFTSEFAEDVMFSLRALYFLNKMVTVPDTYYNYRKNSTSFGGSKSVSKQNYALEERVKALNFITANKINIPMTKFPTQNCIRCKIFNVTILKIKIWNTLKIVYFLGFEILRIIEDRIK